MDERSFTEGRGIFDEDRKRDGVERRTDEEPSDSAFLHDIGEFVRYDYPLDKPALTKEEFEIVKKHPVLGAMALKKIKELRDITPIIRHHHERMDGKGYPDRLKGEEIPVGARIFHLADSFDSMTAPRPYRQPAPGRSMPFWNSGRTLIPSSIPK